MTNSKQKGKRGELELSHYLTDKGFPAKRGQQFKGSPDSPDIECLALSDFHIECKRTERLSLYKALEQAEEDCGEHQTPTVFHRKSRKDWIVILKANDFLEIIKKSRH